MDPLEPCRIREPLCPLTEEMYYQLFVQSRQETGTAVSEPDSAVRTTAEVQHHMVACGVDNSRTQESEELSEEAERLNDRWWDLEQQAGEEAVARHNISLERQAFQDKISQCREKCRKRRKDIYGGHLYRYAHNSSPTPERCWDIPQLLPDDFDTDHEELSVDPYPLTSQIPEEGSSTPLQSWPADPTETPVNNAESATPHEPEPHDETSEEWSNEVHRQR